MAPQAISNTTRDLSILPRNLQDLLKLDKTTRIINYKTSSFVLKGENYGSSVYKVDVTLIKDKKSTEEEQLYLVAKMIPESDFQQSLLNQTITFKKEIFIHEKLLKKFQQLENEYGVKPKYQSDISPKYYGGRLSLIKGHLKADEDAVLLLENLQTRGYYMGNKRKGLDLEHSLLAIKKLAQFHALGIAVKSKKRHFFKKAKKCLNILSVKLDEGLYYELIDQTIEVSCEDPRVSIYKDRIKSCLLSKSYDYMFNRTPVGNWVTIVHGDFWVNNILFHQDNGHVNDVKFIDYQLARLDTLTKDLPFFICCCTDNVVLSRNFEQLVDIYYTTFIDTLTCTGCDVSSFSRDSFDEQLKKDANDELFRCLLTMKIFLQDVSEDLDLNDMKDAVMLSNGNNLYRERSWKVILKFVEKGWI